VLAVWLNETYSPNFVNFFRGSRDTMTIILVFFLFTVLPDDYMQAFCTSAPHRAVVPCDSTAFLIIYVSRQTYRRTDTLIIQILNSSK